MPMEMENASGKRLTLGDQKGLPTLLLLYKKGPVLLLEHIAKGQLGAQLVTLEKAAVKKPWQTTGALACLATAGWPPLTEGPGAAQGMGPAATSTRVPWGLLPQQRKEKVGGFALCTAGAARLACCNVPLSSAQMNCMKKALIFAPSSYPSITDYYGNTEMFYGFQLKTVILSTMEK
ncbi:hypothetical protein Anapl_01630 [Anas platyrhynchos]|uniref:Uncharacterized protein n=1 Tax=Anas platyrhynchos TaxID=8839 RepID=R0JZJ4_ANAPL|nr:hypothetical protein Anapl_01630 [Anas platyrhynchos]